MISNEMRFGLSYLDGTGKARKARFDLRGVEAQIVSVSDLRDPTPGEVMRCKYRGVTVNVSSWKVFPEQDIPEGAARDNHEFSYSERDFDEALMPALGASSPRDLVGKKVVVLGDGCSQTLIGIVLAPEEVLFEK